MDEFYQNPIKFNEEKETSNVFRTDRKSGWNTWLFSGFRGFSPTQNVRIQKTSL